jgi:hypothetical protein
VALGRKATICSSDDVFPADSFGDANDPSPMPRLWRPVLAAELNTNPLARVKPAIIGGRELHAIFVVTSSEDFMSDTFQHPTDPNDPGYVNPYVREAVIVDNRAATTSHIVGLGLSALALICMAIFCYFLWV